MRYLLTTIFLFLALATSASAATDLEIAYSTSPGPCVGNTTIVWASIPTSNGGFAAGAATGIHIEDQGTPDESDDIWTLERCEITIDPVYWATISPYMRCVITTHELEHLHMHRHNEGGIMQPMLNADFYFAPCAVRLPMEMRMVYEVKARTGFDAQCTEESQVRWVCASHRTHYVALVHGHRYTLHLVRARAHRPARAPSTQR